MVGRFGRWWLLLVLIACSVQFPCHFAVVKREGKERELWNLQWHSKRATWCHVGERREMKFQRVPVRTQTERGEYLSYLQLQIPLLVPCPEKRLKVSK